MHSEFQACRTKAPSTATRGACFRSRRVPSGRRTMPAMTNPASAAGAHPCPHGALWETASARGEHSVNDAQVARSRAAAPPGTWTEDSEQTHVRVGSSKKSADSGSHATRQEPDKLEDTTLGLQGTCLPARPQDPVPRPGEGPGPSRPAQDSSRGRDSLPGLVGPVHWLGPAGHWAGSPHPEQVALFPTNRPSGQRPAWQGSQKEASRRG